MFIPLADAESFCSGKMVVELMRSGADIRTISTDPYWPKSMPIDDSRLWRGIEEKTFKIPTRLKGSKLQSILAGLKFRSLNYNKWIKAVIERAVELHKNRPFDIIYSRSLYMYTHKAGYWVSKTLGRPWIANINDPWDFHLFPGANASDVSWLHRTDSNYWFAKTLRKANLVTYPTKRLRDYHVKLSGIDHESEIIPHIGYSTETDSDSQCFRLTHAGKLGSNECTGRSAIGLLKGFKGLLDKINNTTREVKLVLVGPRDEATEQTIKEVGIDPNCIEITGRVNYEESLRYIASSSVCILIEGQITEGIFLPSKFADYLVAKKPILALSPKTGTIADFGDNLGVVRVDPEDSDKIESEMCRLYELFKQGSLSATSNGNLSDKFSGTAVANQFLQCAQKLLQESKR